MGLTDKFTINLSGEWTAALKNIYGQTVKSLSGHGNQNISREELPSGIYLLTINCSNGTVVKQKILFQ